MEHPHTCLYCGVRWWCLEECPLAGATVCGECALDIAPNVPHRVLPLKSWALVRLAEAEAQRVRQQMFGRKRGR